MGAVSRKAIQWLAVMAMSLLLSLGASSVLTERAHAAEFSDAPSTAWYVTGGWIEYVSSHGLMTGSSSRFSPNGTLTRGQAATILYRYANPYSKDSTDSSRYAATAPFDDMKKKAYYNAPVKWCVSKGIVTGYGNGKFGPNDPVTREQLATMMYRFAKSQGMDMSTRNRKTFNAAPDRYYIGAYAQEPMAWCCENGIITGDGSTGSLRPKNAVTRAQMAKVMTATVRDVMSSAGRAFKCFVDNRQYAGMTQSWGKVENYAIVDTNEDGTPELFIEGCDLRDQAFRYTLIFLCRNGSVVPLQNYDDECGFDGRLYTYLPLGYSHSLKSVAYSIVRNTPTLAYRKFSSIQGSSMVEKGCWIIDGNKHYVDHHLVSPEQFNARVNSQTKLPYRPL